MESALRFLVNHVCVAAAVVVPTGLRHISVSVQTTLFIPARATEDSVMNTNRVVKWK